MIHSLDLSILILLYQKLKFIIGIKTYWSIFYHNEISYHGSLEATKFHFIIFDIFL